MKKKILFIANPFSGVSKKKDIHLRVEALLDLQQYEMHFEYTQHAGHAIGLAKEAKDNNFDTVVAIGGDGSINEVASQLVRSKTKLALIATGSGNGFASSVGINRNDLPQSLQIINQAHTKVIDTCKVNDQFFINVSGIGFDGQVSYEVKNGKQRGLLMYLKTGFIASIKYKLMPLKVIVDGKIIKGEFANVSLANGAYYGYNFSIAPLADLTDGVMDLVLIKKTNKLNYYLSSVRFLNGSLHKSKYVEVIKAKEVIIPSIDRTLYYHYDGEGAKSKKDFHFKINPKSLEVLVPKEKA